MNYLIDDNNIRIVEMNNILNYSNYDDVVSYRSIVFQTAIRKTGMDNCHAIIICDIGLIDNQDIIFVGNNYLKISEYEWIDDAIYDYHCRAIKELGLLVSLT